MTITSAPTVPNPNSASFATDAYPFTQWMAALGPEIDAETARINAIGFGAYSATSTTSLAVGTGSKSLTIDTGKSFSVGQPVIIASTANPADYMTGQVTSYDAVTGTLVVNATSTAGSGTVADWTISIASIVAGGGVSPNSIVVLTSGTSWACPTGVTKARLRVVGGGGGGVNFGSASCRSGGGGAGGVVEVFVSLTPATSYTYAIGGGAAVGGGGGTTSMTVSGVTYSAFGGGGGGAWIGGDGGSGSGTGAVVLAGQKGFGNQGVTNDSNVANALSAVGGDYGRGGQGGTTGNAESGGSGAIILELYK